MSNNYYYLDKKRAPNTVDDPEILDRGIPRKKYDSKVVGSRPKGWTGESYRHSLAAKGIETTTKEPKTPKQAIYGRKSRSRTRQPKVSPEGIPEDAQTREYVNYVNRDIDIREVFDNYDSELSKDSAMLDIETNTPDEKSRKDMMITLTKDKMLELYTSGGTHQDMTDLMNAYRGAFRDPNKMLSFYYEVGEIEK